MNPLAPLNKEEELWAEPQGAETPMGPLKGEVGAGLSSEHTSELDSTITASGRNELEA